MSIVPSLKNRFQRLTLAGKLVLVLVSVLVVGFSIMYSFILSNLYRNNLKQAESLATEVSNSYSYKISGQFNILKTLTQSMAAQVETFRKKGLNSRAAVIETQKKFLANNPFVFGITVAYEPNRYDKLDHQYIGATGSGSDGRFIPYAVRDGNSFIVSAAYDETTDMVWYNRPKDTKRIFLTEPTSYMVNGKNTVMASVVCPILDNGEFLGVVSIDYELNDFQSMVEKIRPLGGYARVITNQGTIVADTLSPQQITKKVQLFEENSQLQSQLNRGAYFLQYAQSGKTRQVNLNSYAPIHMEGSDIFWSFCSVIPKKNILSSYYRLRNLILVIAAAFIGIIIMMILIFTNKMVSQPLAKVVFMLQEMSKGHLGHRVKLNQNDEIGVMAKTMDDFADRLQNVTIAAIQKIAVGDLNIAFNQVDENDEITPALAQTVQTIKNIIDEINSLTDAAKTGRLDVRGDEMAFTGDYCTVIEGVNQTLEAFVTPLTDGKNVLQRMGVNDYTLEMNPDKYQGIFRDFAVEINTVKNRLLNVQGTMSNIAKGDIGLLEEFRKIGRYSEHDHLLPSLIAMMENIQSLIDEVGNLSASAVSGNLKARGHAEKFEGGYHQIITGINQTLDTILEPITEASSILQEMAQGKLSVKVRNTYQGDHAILATALNHTIDSFNDVLSEFYHTSEQFASESTHVSNSSQNLSQATAEQAATIEEMNAAINEIANQTKQNALHANEANQLATSAKDSAVVGNEQMHETLNAMAEINKSSVAISKIIRVIDEIAFQTNILALNAAVEAARAGQFGKGFAVVAEEVRNLASRSASAAKETTLLIEDSIQKANSGTNIANQTAKALIQIVDNVTQAAGLIGNIATASNEQALGITQINQGINQVSQATLTNTSIAEQTASVSHQLENQAELLKKLIQRFELVNHRLHPGSRSELAVTPSQSRSNHSQTRPTPKNPSRVDFSAPSKY